MSVVSVVSVMSVMSVMFVQSVQSLLNGVDRPFVFFLLGRPKDLADDEANDEVCEETKQPSNTNST